MMLCEYAAIHLDGTFSVVRGGLEFWNGPRLPAKLENSCLIIIEPNTLEKGEYPITAQLRNPTGLVLWEFSGEVAIHYPAFALRLVLPISASIQAYGDYELQVTVGGSSGTSPLRFEEVTK
jgi:hypothetical protein